MIPPCRRALESNIVVMPHAHHAQPLCRRDETTRPRCRPASKRAGGIMGTQAHAFLNVDTKANANRFAIIVYMFAARR